MKGGENVKQAEKLFEENHAFIYKFLMKLCGNVELSEELTQETFFRAYMNVGSLKDPQKAPVWLCSIAKNAYYAWLSEQKRLCPLDEAIEIPDSANIAEEYSRRELAEQAFRALDTLDQPYREVFMLNVFGEMTFAEISKAYGKSESWARVTFYRAKQKILERMG